MRNIRSGSVDLRDATAEEINEAMTRGAIDALREHKRAGNSVVVWDREKDCVVLVPPEEIIVPDEPAIETEPAATQDQAQG
jgi:hypothetical protein